MKELPTSIQGVIEHLTDIVEWAKAEESRLGYFAALYRKVTIDVKQKIERGDFFADGPRMERLDVVFANRYLEAYELHHRNMKPTRSWRYAFDSADQWWPIVLQQLLLGMNAHINLDLGIAAADTAPGRLPSLREDFNRINEVLFARVDGVHQELSAVWPLLRLFGRRLGDVETSLIRFSMKKARNEAWALAEQLDPMSDHCRAEAISARDEGVKKLGGVVRHPGIVLSTMLRIVRMGETTSVRRVIEILE